MLTFKQAFDRITEAYIKGEMHPYSPCGCFVGNLFNRKDGWDGLLRHCVSDNNDVLRPYTPARIKCPVLNSHKDSVEFIRTELEGTYTEENVSWLEYIFMLTYYKECKARSIPDYNFVGDSRPVVEDALFIAMEKTLDELKKIHITLGQDIEETVFTKRQLQTT